MPRLWRTQIGNVGLLLLCGLMGCGDQHSSVPGPSALKPDSIHVQLPQVQAHSPLTVEEISALVAIAGHLPGNDLPRFASVSGSQSLYAPLPEFVAAERDRLAASLDPHWQAAQWRQNPDIAQRLDELGVDPVNLATSMLRVSSAWTALMLKRPDATVRAGASRVEFLEVCLERQLSLARMQFQRPLTEWQREQQLNAIRETLACLQLSRMCAAVPDEHLDVINEYRDVLQPLLPTATSLSRLEQRIESKAAILQMSAENVPQILQK